MKNHKQEKSKRMTRHKKELLAKKEIIKLAVRG